MERVALVEGRQAAQAPAHAWWRPLRAALVPGEAHRLTDALLQGFLEHLRRTGHAVDSSPQAGTNLLLTTARFGQPVPWRRALMLTHRRAFSLEDSPTVVTVVTITPDELESILEQLETALRREPPDPADFAFPGLTERAHRVLIEQGRRGGPILSLVRLVQSQAISIRVVLLVADERPRAAYYFDLVGAHPRVAFDDPDRFYADMARRLATAVSTHEVTDHVVTEPALPEREWQRLSTPAAMERASLEFGRRGFFTEMVRVADLVNVPGLAETVAAQYSEGCFATWDGDIQALVATITGSARPVDKGRISQNELALIVGVRPGGAGAVIRQIEGHADLAPSSEAVEMMRMDAVLPRVRPAGARSWLPVLRSKLHGHRGVARYDPARVEFVALDPPYYAYPVSCSTEAQAAAIERAFGRAESLHRPDDPRTIAFTVMPGHGVVAAEKWVEGKGPFQELWEAMDGGALEISKEIPQGWFDYRRRPDGWMALTEG